MLQSYLIYCTLLVAGVFFAWCATDTKRKIFVVAIALSFAAIAGLRAPSVGMDTIAYTKVFDQIFAGNIESAYGEKGFKYLVYLLSRISQNKNFIFFVFALTTNLLMLLRLWDFEETTAFQWVVFCYYITFFFFSLNGLRQALAISIIFYATKYLKKGYFLFLLSIIVAMFFHKSAIIALAYLPCELFKWKYLPRKQKNLLITLFCVSPFFVIYAFNLLTTQYSYFFDTLLLDIGWGVVIKIGLILFTSWLVSYDRKDRGEKVLPLQAKEDQMIKIYYLFGLFLTAFSYIIPLIGRIGLYLYVYESVYMGWAIKNYKKDDRLKLIIGCFFLILLFIELLGNGQYAMPYLFIWQT